MTAGIAPGRVRRTRRSRLTRDAGAPTVSALPGPQRGSILNGERGGESSGALEALAAAVHVEFGAMTHTGKVRPINEDHYLIARQRKSLETVRTNLKRQDDINHAEIVGYLMVVADGVGGAAAGERASAIVLSEIEK